MDNNKLIIHVAQTFSGGVASVILNLIDQQIKQGFSVGIMFPLSESNLVNESINEKKIFLFPVKSFSIFKMNQLIGLPIYKIYRKIKKTHKKSKVVIHAHGTSVIGLIRNINKLPLVLTIHGINSTKSKISLLLTDFIIRKVASRKYPIIGVSEHTCRFYNKRLKQNYILTIHNGTFITKGVPVIKSNLFVIAYIAYIDDFKGWKYLYSAYKNLDSKLKNEILLIFAGDGNKSDVKLLTESIINDNESNVMYLGNVKNANSVLVPFVNLIVLPSISEGLSMTLIESLGNSIPILATNVGGTPEILHDSETGLFIERNGENINQKIKLIYHDKELYQRISRKAREYFTKNFTADTMADSYENIYFEVFTKNDK